MRCDALVTGDRTHFGPGYGQTFGGVTMYLPAQLALAIFPPAEDCRHVLGNAKRYFKRFPAPLSHQLPFTPINCKPVLFRSQVPLEVM
jgi:hypothetical protein